MKHEEMNLQNQLLIAMPGLGDPRFEHTVTLICRHDTLGCFGLTINRPIAISVSDLLGQLEITPGVTELENLFALSGGPLQKEQGFVVHDTDRVWENTLRISDDLAVTASRDILTDIANGNGPDNFLLALGCSSWTPGQLENEMLDNAWLTCPAEHRIIFEMPYEQRWQGASDLLGVDVSLMTNTIGHA
jgi:putative transcriptional regulator